MTRPILVLDFDGVLHSYASGWQGAKVIPDPPVDGAIAALLEYLQHFDVAILSSRSHQWGGRGAMKRWLWKHLVEYAERENTPGFGPGALPFFSPGMDPWDDEVGHWAETIVGMVRWPWFKPPAILTIDDRAHQFTGKWPSVDLIQNFKPWNKR